MCHNTHSPTRATSTLPSWVSDMMAHVVPDRVAEFSISGTGDDVSVFWEPDLSYTDPFVLPASSFQPPSGQNLEFPILPSPVPDAKSSKLGTDALLPSHASRARHGGTALEHLIRVIDAMQNAERKGSEGKKAEADRVHGELVVRAQDIHNTRKRNLDDVDIDPNNECKKEDTSPNHAPKQLSPHHGVPCTKRICREKTGTEWQTVLDVIKHGEEVLRSKPLL
ncbi:hypothetical protein C8R48DRAFT_670783 [Suillus tomentosus]|nr:hypothetical protein C8R48DRAFT_670783 [Suillus tomentosus]